MKIKMDTLRCGVDSYGSSLTNEWIGSSHVGRCNFYSCWSKMRNRSNRWTISESRTYWSLCRMVSIFLSFPFLSLSSSPSPLLSVFFFFPCLLLRFVFLVWICCFYFFRYSFLSVLIWLSALVSKIVYWFWYFLSCSFRCEYMHRISLRDESMLLLFS